MRVESRPAPVREQELARPAARLGETVRIGEGQKRARLPPHGWGRSSRCDRGDRVGVAALPPPEMSRLPPRPAHLRCARPLPPGERWPRPPSRAPGGACRRRGASGRAGSARSVRSRRRRRRRGRARRAPPRGRRPRARGLRSRPPRPSWRGAAAAAGRGAAGRSRSSGRRHRARRDPQAARALRSRPLAAAHREREGSPGP